MPTTTHTLISGETVAFDAAPELATFLAEAVADADDPTVTVSDLVDRLYGEANPLLVRGVIPGRGYVTPEILTHPAYRVMVDLLYRKQLATAARAEEHTVSVTEAARRLGISTSAVRQAIAAGRLPAVKRSGQHWLREDALASYQVARRGPAPSEDRAPVLRVRVGTEGNTAMQVRSDGELATGPDPTAPHVRSGELVGWSWVAVKTARKDLGSLRFFELRPGTVERELRVGQLVISGRFEIVRKVNNAADADAAWKAVGAEQAA